MLYDQGNVIGTVSQSGGVATGALFESGSNANGTYSKFADGTLICTVQGFELDYLDSATIRNELDVPAFFHRHQQGDDVRHHALCRECRLPHQLPQWHTDG